MTKKSKAPYHQVAIHPDTLWLVKFLLTVSLGIIIVETTLKTLGS